MELRVTQTGLAYAFVRNSVLLSRYWWLTAEMVHRPLVVDDSKIYHNHFILQPFSIFFS